MGNEVENIDKGSDHVQCDKKVCFYFSYLFLLCSVITPVLQLYYIFVILKILVTPLK